MENSLLAGSPRVLRTLNEKAVLFRLLSDGPLTRMELEAFTGLSKPAMFELLRRLELAGLITRKGEKSGTSGPKAGLWSIEPRCGHVAGLEVTNHGIEVALADICGAPIASVHWSCEPADRYDARSRLKGVLDDLAAQAGISLRSIDQFVVGLPGIVDAESGNLRKGLQLPNWEGFHIAEMIGDLCGHRHVLIENDVNLVALEEMSAGAAEGVQSFLLLWIGDGVGAGVVLGGRLLRGTTGAAGEIGGILVPVDAAAGGNGFATLEEALSLTAIDALRRRHGIAGADTLAAIRQAANTGNSAFFAELGGIVGRGLMGPIAVLDPHMVVLGGPTGHAGGKALAQAVAQSLEGINIASPQIVTSGVDDDAVRSGALHLALQHARERIFSGGSAARGQP